MLLLTLKVKTKGSSSLDKLKATEKFTSNKIQGSILFSAN